MKIENFISNLLLAVIVGFSGYTVSRIEKIQDQAVQIRVDVAQLQVDVAALKVRESSIASLTSPRH